MLELMSIAEIKIAEVILGIVFTLITIIITIALYKIKKVPYFVLGFLLITLWNILETLDELFLQGIARELIFNIGGRIILITGVIVLLLGYRKLTKTKYKELKIRMIKKQNKKNNLGKWIFFWVVLILGTSLFFFHGITEVIGDKAYHLIITLVNIPFIVFVILISTKIKNLISKKYILFGGVILIFAELFDLLSFFLLGNLGLSSYLVSRSFFTVVGLFLVLYGFKEAAN